MTPTEKIKQILVDYTKRNHISASTVILEQYAEELVKNGVIVPPCKVGKWVYVPWRYEGQFGIATAKIEEIKFYDSAMHYMFLIDMESDDESFNQLFGGWEIGDSIGKTVFLTREEAEKELAERDKK